MMREASVRFVLLGLLLLPVTSGCRGKKVSPPTPTDLLMQAIDAGDVAKVKQFIDGDPSLIAARDEYQKTPLHHAASAGNMEIVKFLLEKGADPTARDKWNVTPTERAALKGHNEIAALLMSAPLPEGAAGEKPLYANERERRREMRDLLNEAAGGAQKEQ